MDLLLLFAGLNSSLACMSLNIYHESRYEPEQGQYAVAYVTANRSRKRNESICTTVFKPRQFSWTNTALDTQGNILLQYIPKDNDPKWQASQEIARSVLFRDARDFTKGATFFHADYVRPGWASKKVFVTKIGKHLFYREPPYPRKILSD